MKRKQHITAFYLETLLMIVVLISIILMLTRVFGSARVQSSSARKLTEAVTLAQNTAEAVSASGSPQQLWEILNEDGSAVLRLEEGSGAARITAVYNEGLQPVALSPSEIESLDLWTDSLAQAEQADNADRAGKDGKKRLRVIESGDLIVQTAWLPSAEEERQGLVDAAIRVYDAGSGKQIYDLDTSVYLLQE